MVRRLVPGSLILLYHRVADPESDPWSLCVTQEHFAEHLQVLLDHRRPIPLVRLAGTGRIEDAAQRSVAVSFDDGYADNLHAAKPLLERYDVPATAFLVAGDIGGVREFWWDELERLLLQPGVLPEVLELQVDGAHHRWELGSVAELTTSDYARWRSWHADDDPPPSLRHALYMSLYDLLYALEHVKRQDVLAELRDWANVESDGRSTHRRLRPEEIIELSDGGLVEIGAHTVVHSDLSTLSPALQRVEIETSKTLLQDLKGGPVSSFSYPHGGYTEETIAAVRGAGFSRACCSRAATFRRGADPFVLPRVTVPDCGGEEFAGLLRSYLAF